MDHDFIEWCRNPDNHGDEVWQNWLDLHPEMQEKLADAERLVNEVKIQPLDLKDRKSALWDRIEASIELNDRMPIVKSRERRMTWWWVAAASLLILVTARMLWPSYDIIETDNGQQMAYVLPDGSIAHLNDGTNIRMNSRKFLDDRQLELVGEAFFEVEKGSRFLVKTSEGSIQVLGTSFNVYARDASLEVHCNTGRVQVTTDRDTIILTPGKHVVKNVREGLVEGEFNIETEGDWTDGKFQFKNKPLHRVFEELERQYDVTVPTNLSSRLYSGFFNDHNLDSALHNICWPMQLSYEIEGTTVEIKSDN